MLVLLLLLLLTKHEKTGCHVSVFRGQSTSTTRERRVSENITIHEAKTNIKVDVLPHEQDRHKFCVSIYSSSLVFFVLRKSSVW